MRFYFAKVRYPLLSRVRKVSRTLMEVLETLMSVGHPIL